MNQYNFPFQNQQQHQQQSDPTGGLSNFSLLLISLNGLTVIVIILIIICHRAPSQEYHSSLQQNNQDNIPYEQALEDADVSLLNRAQRRARAKLLMKKSRRLDTGGIIGTAAGGGEHVQEHDHVPNHDNDHPIGQHNENAEQGHRIILTRKERQKVAKQIERMERHANSERARQQQQQEQTMYELKQQKLQMAQLQQMEKEKRYNLEKERQNLHRVYMFPDTDLDTRVTIDEFIKELEVDPIISLEETAEEFQVSQQDLVHRLQELERDGRIPHGIWNRQRGEYLYVGENTMDRMAHYIMEQGAVSLTDIRKELLRCIQQDEDIIGEPPLALEQKKNQ